MVEIENHEPSCKTKSGPEVAYYQLCRKLGAKACGHCILTPRLYR